MTPWKYSQLTGRPPPRRRGLLPFGLGAGVLGIAGWFSLRFFIRSATTARIPDAISPAIFTRRAFTSSRGGMVYHESAPGAGAAGADAPTLVFIHDVGVGTSSYEWSKVYPAFTDTHRVLALDLIGFGESERPEPALRAADHVTVLGEFLQNIAAGLGGGPAPVLIARGLGAGLCVRLAAGQPALVSRLVLLLPTGKAEVSATLKLASRVPTLGRLIYRNHVALRTAIRRRLETFSFADPTRVTAETVEVHALCAQQYQAGHAVRAWWGGALNVALEKSFRVLACPVSILLPARAPVRLRERGVRLARLNPRAGATRELPDLGPLAALEGPDVVTEALRAELAVTPTAPAAEALAVTALPSA